MDTDLLEKVGFEVPIAGLVKMDQDRYDFAFRQLAAALALDGSCLQKKLAPGRGKGQPKIIDIAKQFE